MKINPHPKDLYIQLSDICGQPIYGMAFKDNIDDDTINPNYLDNESTDRAIQLLYTAYRILRDHKDHNTPIPAIQDLEHDLPVPDNKDYTF